MMLEVIAAVSALQKPGQAGVTRSAIRSYTGLSDLAFRDALKAALQAGSISKAGSGFRFKRTLTAEAAGKNLVGSDLTGPRWKQKTKKALLNVKVKASRFPANDDRSVTGTPAQKIRKPIFPDFKNQEKMITASNAISSQDKTDNDCKTDAEPRRSTRRREKVSL